MRVLLTGDNGYIGSVLAPLMADAGHDVVGLDTGFFDRCTIQQATVANHRSSKDIRDLEPGDLNGFDAVVHLAALSNDPIGNLNSAWTTEINLNATARLAELAKKAGVTRFLFSSSCIMYGTSEAAFVDESSPLDPKTEYARSKVAGEQAIAQMADETFSPTFLRNGTVYGLSPRMRFDTVVNNLVGSAMTTGCIVVHSDGAPWRPVIHVKDVARAFLHVLQSPREAVHNQAFNTGADHLNHQIIDIAHTVAEIVPGCRIEIMAEPGADQRTYRTDFKKFASTFPTFRFEYSLANGVRDLYTALQQIPLTASLFQDSRFTRLKWLNHLLSTGELDNSLRWKVADVSRDHQRALSSSPAGAL